MNAKLTLRLDQGLIAEAKSEAEKRGKSVSQMVADFFTSLSDPQVVDDAALPPITRALCGALENQGVDEQDYKNHLAEKYS